MARAVVQSSTIQIIDILVTQVILLWAVPTSFSLFVFLCNHLSCSGLGVVAVWPTQFQVKMNSCYSVAFSPDQFCNLVRAASFCTLTQLGEERKSLFRLVLQCCCTNREQDIRALFTSLLHHSLQHSGFPKISQEGYCLPYLLYRKLLCI